MAKFNEMITKDGHGVNDTRCTLICEKAKAGYKRAIEDLEESIRTKEMKREELLDLSGLIQGQIAKSSTFSGGEFVQEDSGLSVDIYNQDLTLQIMKGRYEVLFGSE